MYHGKIKLFMKEMVNTILTEELSRGTVADRKAIEFISTN